MDVPLLTDKSTDLALVARLVVFRRLRGSPPLQEERERPRRARGRPHVHRGRGQPTHGEKFQR